MRKCFLFLEEIFNILRVITKAVIGSWELLDKYLLSSFCISGSPIILSSETDVLFLSLNKVKLYAEEKFDIPITDMLKK